MKTKKTVQSAPSYSISDSEFYGVKWDAEALQSVQTVAQALLNLTELFKAQNIHIDSLLHVGPHASMAFKGQTSFDNGKLSMDKGSRLKGDTHEN
jgi:hypothetical protein